jgi:ABC-type spermidine/putrescine transport system permease subunit II
MSVSGTLSVSMWQRWQRINPFEFASWIYGLVFFVFLYSPLVMITVLSFNDSRLTGFPLKGFTTKWYEAVFASQPLLSALANSIYVGLASAAIATTLALLMALAFRHDFWGKRIVLYLILMPIILPGIIGGIVLLIFFGYLGIRPSLFTTVLVGHVNWVLPFAFLTLYPRLHKFDRSLEDAAMDLGARTSQVFWEIVFPIVRPSVIATAIFAFSLSFDEFIRTIFTVGSDRTIPVQFYVLIVEELSPELPAMAVIIILLTTVVSLLGFAFMRRADRSNSA